MIRSLGIIDVSRRERGIVTKELLQAIIGAGLVAIYVAKVTDAPTDHIDQADSCVAENSSIVIYAIVSRNEIDEGQKVICGTAHWDRSSFLVIVGESKLADEILSKAAAIQGFTLPELQQVLDSQVEGYFFPVDYELAVGGSTEFARLVAGIEGLET